MTTADIYGARLGDDAALTAACLQAAETENPALSTKVSRSSFGFGRGASLGPDVGPVGRPVVWALALLARDFDAPDDLGPTRAARLTIVEPAPQDELDAAAAAAQDYVQNLLSASRALGRLADSDANRDAGRAARVARVSVASSKAIAAALRSLLRFLHLERVIDRDLAVAVPTVANWRLASLVKAVGAGFVAKLL